LLHHTLLLLQELKVGWHASRQACWQPLLHAQLLLLNRLLLHEMLVECLLLLLLLLGGQHLGWQARGAQALQVLQLLSCG
jgi:hypothetical protein